MCDSVKGPNICPFLVASYSIVFLLFYFSAKANPYLGKIRKIRFPFLFGLGSSVALSIGTGESGNFATPYNVVKCSGTNVSRQPESIRKKAMSVWAEEWPRRSIPRHYPEACCLGPVEGG